MQNLPYFRYCVTERLENNLVKQDVYKYKKRHSPSGVISGHWVKVKVTTTSAPIQSESA